MKNDTPGGNVHGAARAGLKHQDPLEILIAKIRTNALRDMGKAVRETGAEKLLCAKLIEKYHLSTDDRHLLERWVMGELIRAIASGNLN